MQETDTETVGDNHTIRVERKCQGDTSWENEWGREKKVCEEQETPEGRKCKAVKLGKQWKHNFQMKSGKWIAKTRQITNWE